MFGDDDRGFWADGEDVAAEVTVAGGEGEKEFAEDFAAAEDAAAAPPAEGSGPEPEGEVFYTKGFDPNVVTINRHPSWTDVNYHTSDGIFMLTTFYGAEKEHWSAADAYAKFIAESFQEKQEKDTKSALDADLRFQMGMGTSPVEPAYSPVRDLAWGMDPDDAVRMQAVRDAFRYAQMRHHLPVSDIIAAAEAFEMFYKYGGDA